MNIAPLFACWLALQSGGAEVPLLRVGITAEGEIVDSDSRVRTEAIDKGFIDAPVLAKRYRIEVEVPGTYTIELRSYLFDAYLVLRDDAGDVLAEDDDGLLGTQARITVELAAEKRYELEACAGHGGRGAFELRFVRGSGAQLSPSERSAAELEDAKKSVELRERVLGPQHPHTATSLTNLGGLLYALGDYDAALPLFERVLAIHEKADGPTHPETANALNNLAVVQRARGDLDGALRLYERALAIREELLGPEHPDTALSLDNLAKLLHARGELDRAQSLFERALAIRESRFGPSHVATARSLDSLAVLLHDRGDLDGALPLLERALAIREELLGPTHPDTATSLSNLASLLKDRGDLDAALPLNERSLAIWENAVGPMHLNTARSLNNLALLLQFRGDLDRALALCERALEIYEKVLGPTHPETALGLNNLARVLHDRGDLDGALPLLERAVAIRESVLGATNPDTAKSVNNLAGLLWARGDFDGARPLYERALAVAEKVLGPTHPDTARSLECLALLLHDRGDLDAALPLYERARAIREEVLGPMHPHTAASLSNLGLLLKDRGDLDGALPLFERALEIRDKVHGATHPETAAVLNNLALLLEARGDLDGARPRFERALAIQETTLGPTHPSTASTLSNLGLLLEARGDLDGALPILERALAAREKVLGATHPDTARSLAKLALLAADRGDPARALELLQRSLHSNRASRLSLLSSASERESCLYLASMRWQIEALSSLSSGRDAAEAILSWKHQAGRALHARRAGLHAQLSTEQASDLGALKSVQSRLSKLAFSSEIQDRELHQRELARLQEERERLERSLAAEVDVLLPEAPSLDEVHKALPAGSALVDVFVHRVYKPAQREDGKVIASGRWLERRVSAWITRPDREESIRVDLGTESSVQESITAFLHELLARDGEELAQRGRAVRPAGTATDAGESLRRQVWDPLASKLDGVTRVFVSPDGPLATLPFETLTLEDGSFLVEKVSFVYLQSADSLTRAHAETAIDESLLAVGGVDYGAESPAAWVAAAASRPSPWRGSELRRGFSERWNSLAFTREESELVKLLYGQVFSDSARLLLEGADATEERLKRELPLHATAHIATHGFFNPEGLPSLWKSALEETQKEQSGTSGGQHVLAGRAPGLLCGLVCAGVNAEPEEGRDDGYLTAEEVGWLDLSKVELVVLSACETALGKAESGEGLLGLRRAFELAGAKTVVSSLWSVKDQSTARLMQSFYENLWMKKMGRADALRAAQLELLAKNRAQYEDPLSSTWGAFVLGGEWR